MPIYINEAYVTDAVDKVIQQQLDEKKALRREVTRKTLVIEELQSGKKEVDSRVHFLTNKFKSGIKLTHDEIFYLRHNTKGIIDHIEQISHEREFTEQQMRVAPTKIVVQNIVLLALQQIAKLSSYEERAVRTMQIAEAQFQYMQNNEYKDKTNDPFGNSEKLISPQLVNKNQMQHTMIAIVAYEQAKLSKINRL